MSNLVDTFLSKVENIASRPSRVMAIADAVLDRIATKDVASAEVFYEYQTGPCSAIVGCPSGQVKTKYRRTCNCHYPSCCGSWQAVQNICC